MRKYLFIILTGLAFNTAQSQEVASGLRFSQDNVTGTARFRAMSGAFGALGGDLSSLNVNPAGSAVFVNNQLHLQQVILILKISLIILALMQLTKTAHLT